MMNKAFLAASISVVMALPALAEMSIEEQIETRQSAYQFAAWNGKKIKAWALEGSDEYTEQEIKAVADAIAAVANSGMDELFTRDSANDKAEHTYLKPNFFTETDNVKKLVTRFSRESIELQQVAGDGDRDVVAEQFNQVVDTCKSCHDTYRAER